MIFHHIIVYHSRPNEKSRRPANLAGQWPYWEQKAVFRLKFPYSSRRKGSFSGWASGRCSQIIISASSLFS